MKKAINLARVSAFIITIASVLAVGAALFFASPVSAQVAPTCTIWADPASLSTSGSTTLYWNSSYATSASLNNGIGNVGTNGSWYISILSADRTYTLTVNGLGGTTSCSVTIPVGTSTTHAPTCSLSASLDNVASGNGTQLTWSTTNANSVYLSNVGSVSTYGSQYVYPTANTTYTLTATGNGGTTTCSKTITVNGSGTATSTWPSCTLSAQPQYVFPNGSAVLKYVVTNATSAWIDGGVGNVSNGTGYETIYGVTAPRTYTLTVSNSYGTQTCSADIALTSYDSSYYSGNASSYYYPYGTYNNTSYGHSYAYPYLDYQYPQNYGTSYSSPSYYGSTYTQPYTYAQPQYNAYKSVSLAHLPYTGPEDVAYVLSMLALALGAGYLAYRNRAVVLGSFSQ